MKKIILLLGYIISLSVTLALDCTPTHRAYDEAQKTLAELIKKSYITPKEYREVISTIKAAEYELNSCENELTQIFQEGFIQFEAGDYIASIQHFERYLSGNQDAEGENYIRATKNLTSSYNVYADTLFNEKKWSESIKYYEKALKIDSTDYDTRYSLGSAYYNQGVYDRALVAYEKSGELAQTEKQKKSSKKAIKQTQILLSKEVLKNTQAQPPKGATNDPYSGIQYYIESLHISETWLQITHPKKAIVAVIDNGVDENHPDLTGNIWENSEKIYETQQRNNDKKTGLQSDPLGEHGTMVAGIIGARSNNETGISGISQSVEIMPLQVFDKNGLARETSIIRAINFAIDHGANIINVSIGESEFRYSDRFDDVIKRAYNEGIIIVIAAGNGDTAINEGRGVDTTLHPISPVCNNDGQTKYTLGVGSLDIHGEKSSWSNYGQCVQIYAPGENIVSTSIADFNKEFGTNYNTLSGTSFATPIVSGIVALGYNKYGYIKPDLVKKSLIKSTKKTVNGESIVDAKNYLKNLSKKQKMIKKDQTQRKQKIQEKKIIDTLSDEQALLQYNIVDSSHMWGERVKREEVIEIGLRLGKIKIPTEYICRGYFGGDTTNTKSCAIREIAVDHGIITKEEGMNPEKYLSKIETLEMLLRSTDILSGAHENASVERIIHIGEYYHFIAAESYLYPDEMISKIELFALAKKILKQKI